MTAQHDNLVIALDAIVPLHILELRDRTPEQRVAIAVRCAGDVAHRGDLLQFRGAHRWKTATTFNSLAQGLAAAAYLPGGITWAGRHWCVDHAVCEGAEPAQASTPTTPAVACPPLRAITDVELPA